jgi:hypothetical protein
VCSSDLKEPSGTAEHLPSTLLVSPKKQTHLDPRIAGTGFTPCGGHHDQAAIGSEFKDGLMILGTQKGELLGSQP